MKKKSGKGSGRAARPAKPAKPAKAPRAAKAAKAAKAVKSANPTQNAKSAKTPKAAKPARAAAPAKPANKKSAKPAAKGGKGAKAPMNGSAAAVPSRVRTGPAPLIPALEPVFDPVAGTATPAASAKGAPKARREAEGDDEGALRSVMSSLASIFGGKDIMSDAELDALLDDKMASGEIPPSAALDPLDEAQSLIYEAWNSQGPQRVRLAHRALETCPDCADAYVILAEEEAQGRKQALDLFRKGVEAAERALHPSLFEKSKGRFWEVMETRPYMRARLGLAECLWELGRKDEAVGHLRDLLRLNPADDQGVRYILAQCLLETGADEELGEILERFRGDASPQIRYSHALWMFRHEGPGRKADGLLAEAVASNPHVPDYLLKRKKLPKEAPGLAEAGSEEEAAAYAMGALESWHKTLGAADWLAEAVVRPGTAR